MVFPRAWSSCVQKHAMRLITHILAHYVDGYVDIPFVTLFPLFWYLTVQYTTWKILQVAGVDGPVLRAGAPNGLIHRLC